MESGFALWAAKVRQDGTEIAGMFGGSDSSVEFSFGGTSSGERLGFAYRKGNH